MIRAFFYLGLALMFLSAVFPNQFPVLIVGGAVALGAYGTRLEGGPDVEGEVRER